MILTSNRGFAEWGEVFGDTVVATALLDRLLHHAVVVHIEGASYRLRRHADLIQDSARVRPMQSTSHSPATKGTDLQSNDRLNSPRLPDLDAGWGIFIQPFWGACVQR